MLGESLPTSLKSQLETIPQLSGYGTVIHACAAKLHSGEFIPRLVLTGIRDRQKTESTTEKLMHNAFDMPAIIKKAASISGIEFDIEQLQSEDRKRHHELVPSEIAELYVSEEATPIWLYERIHAFLETGMGYHIVSFQSKRGASYTCLTYSPAFIRLPKEVHFEDIIEVERLGKEVSTFDCGDAGHWMCHYSME